MCQQLKDYGLEEGGEHVLELLHNLCHFRAQLRREDMQNAEQRTLEDTLHRGVVYVTNLSQLVTIFRTAM